MYYSPVKHEKKMLEMIGRKLKKNSVALDIVNFGEEDEQKTEKLEALLAAVNNNGTSHIVHVPPGPNALSDVLIRFVCSISSSCTFSFLSLVSLLRFKFNIRIYHMAYGYSCNITLWQYTYFYW